MNKIVVGLIIIIILILISFMVIGFVNNANQMLEERNKESAEIKKLKGSAVDLIYDKLLYKVGVNVQTNETEDVSSYIYEGKIAYIEGRVEYAKEQNRNYLSIKFKTDSIYELNDKDYRPEEKNALLKLVYSEPWKVGDTFSGYVKVLPFSDYYSIDYPVQINTKFNGDRYMDGNKIIHFEEVKMMFKNSKNLNYMP